MARDSVVRNTSVIAALTLLSRVLGMARDILSAAVFGASVQWDAFLFAFRIPNLFRKLFGEGALSAAFIPAFTRRLENEPPAAARAMAGRIAGTLALVLTVLLAVGEAFVIGRLLAGGLEMKWQLVLAFTAVLLPYMLLICLTALAGSILQSLREFTVPAMAPVALNVLWILSVLTAGFVLDLDMRTRVYVVCGGILVAGFVQLGMQWAALRRMGFQVKLSLAPGHPDVRTVARSMGPVILGLAALQINVLLDGVIAVGLAGQEGESLRLGGLSVLYPMRPGANSVLYYANRLMQFPLGVFGISLATAAFPGLSSCAARKDWRGFSRSFMRGMRLLVWLSIPASVGLIVMRMPVVDLIFNHGRFEPEHVRRTAFCVMAYSTAIWAYCALHVLSRAFYSINRHSTPAKVAGVMVGLNLALNLTLVWWLREAGLAAATAICAVIQVVILGWLLSRRVHLAGWRQVAITAARSMVAAGLMGALCVWLLGMFPQGPLSGRVGLRLLRVLLPIGAGVLAYGGLSLALGAEEMRMFVRSILRRDKKN